mgnify:CR=1 FL=1
MTDAEIITQIMRVDPATIGVINPDMRRFGSKSIAKAIRSLLKSHGIKCVRCTMDRHWTGGVTLHIDRPENRTTWRNDEGIRFVVGKATIRIRQIVLAAFPDLHDRTDPSGDSCVGDTCFRVTY